jgi:hypothetical protein
LDCPKIFCCKIIFLLKNLVIPMGYKFININYWCEIAKSPIHGVVVESHDLNLSLIVLFGSCCSKNECGLLNPCKSQANSVKNPF